MTTEKRICTQCNGKGYKESLRFTGAVVSRFKDRCIACSGSGYTKKLK
jgi:DnaJ-class molecular chaperone